MSSFRVKYACPEEGVRRFEISPSTHTAGNRSSSDALIRIASSLTVQTTRSLMTPSPYPLPLRGRGFDRPPLPSGERVGVRATRRSP